MKKKLAIVAHHVNNRGGMELHLLEVIKRASKDYDITVIATEFSGEIDNVKFMKIPIPQRPAFIRSVLFTLIVSLILLFKRFDFVHTTGAIVLNRVDMSTVHFCHRAYKSLGFSERYKHSTSLLHKVNSYLHGKLALFMEGICYRPNQIPVLVAVSEHVKKELLEQFNYEEENIVVIYNGVDTKTYKPITIEEKKKLRTHLGIPESAIVFSFIGGDWSRKGLRILLDAFGELLNCYPSKNMKVLVVGKGDKKIIMSGLSNEIAKNVIFQGFHEDPSIFYKVSDVFVLPSLYETFSIAALEAGACGLPVVMTKVGISDIVAENGVTGFTIERDSKNLKIALEQILLNDVLREDMASEVRKRSEKITWDRTYELFRGYYKQFI